jgi:hypothetical protein
MNQIDENSCEDVMEAYSKKMQVSRCFSDAIHQWLKIVAPLKFDATRLEQVGQDSSDNEWCCGL